MEKNRLNKYDYKILLIVFALIPVIDFINGVILTSLEINSSISLGKVYRIITMFVLIVIMIKYSDKKVKQFKFIIFSLLILGIYMAIFYFNHFRLEGIIYDIVFISKPLLILIIIYSMINLYKGSLIDLEFIEKIFDIFLILFPITMIVPYLFGVGSSTYSGGLGYTSFYYANNDLSIVLLVCCIFALDKLIKKHSIKNSIIFIGNLVSLLLVGSKTGVIGIILVCLIYLFYYGKSIIKKNKISKKNILIIMLSIIISIITIFIIFYPMFLKMIDRFIYFYNIEGNIFSAILSGREKYLASAFDNFLYKDFKIIKLLFGVGFYYRKSWGVGQVIEMDLFDCIFSFGILITVFLIYGLIKLVNTMIKRLNDNNLKYLSSLIILISFSTIAGHVIFSALSGSFLALIIVGAYMLKST